LEKSELLEPSEDLKQNKSTCFTRILTRLNTCCKYCGVSLCRCIKNQDLESGNAKKILERHHLAKHEQNESGYGKKILVCFQACLSFFYSASGNRKKKSLGEALKEYTEMVRQQHDEVKQIQLALSQNLSEIEARNRELYQQLEEVRVDIGEMFFQGSFFEKNTEYKATTEELNQDEEMYRLQEMLRNYPMLPEEACVRSLTIDDVNNITAARLEHHAAVMDLASHCLEDNYVGLYQGFSKFSSA
jgi:hypothetical protein